MASKFRVQPDGLADGGTCSPADRRVRDPALLPGFRVFLHQPAACVSQCDRVRRAGELPSASGYRHRDAGADTRRCGGHRDEGRRAGVSFASQPDPEQSRSARPGGDAGMVQLLLRRREPDLHPCPRCRVHESRGQHFHLRPDRGPGAGWRGAWPGASHQPATARDQRLPRLSWSRSSSSRCCGG